MTSKRIVISNGEIAGKKRYTIWVDDFGEPEKVGCNFEDTGYMTPEQARVVATEIMKAAHVAENNRCLYPSHPEDRRVMTIGNLIDEAREIADGRAEILFADSIGFIGWGEPPEAGVMVVAAFTTIGGLPTQISPERAERIKAALAHAMAVINQQDTKGTP